MTQFQHGGDLASYLFTVGTANAAVFAPGATVKVWAERTGTNQITDLADASGNPITTLTAGNGSDGWPVGGLPIYRAPLKVVWVGQDGQPRVLSVTSDLPGLVDQLVTDMQAAVAAANAAAASAAALAGSSSIAGHEAALDPHPGYHNNARGDARYVLARPGTIAPLDEPLQVLTFSETPAADAANIREVYVTHSEVTRLGAWDNERGNPRREQLPGALWDNLYVGIAAYNGTGRPFAVEIRGVDNVRRNAGGIDAKGRPVTSDQAWTQITLVDPDETGDYEASDEVGPAPLAVRWDTDDVVRLQGRITAAGVTAGDALAELPSGFAPLSSRLMTAGTSTGVLVVVELLTTGRIVARTTVAGPLDVSLDDLTYARVEAPQPSGEWTIDAAGTATPGTSSPISVAHSGVTGRLYLLVLARSSAADPFTTVTDNGSNTWTRQAYAPTSGSVGRRVELWTCQPGSAFTSVSVAFTGTGTAYASLYEVTGHDTGDPLDQVAANHRSSSTSPAAVEITPSVPGTLVVAAIAASPNNLSQITPSGGWTALTSHSGGPAVVYQTDPAAGVALGVAWTLATSAGSGHVIASFNPE